jgi:hypothetical protein
MTLTLARLDTAPLPRPAFVAVTACPCGDVLGFTAGRWKHPPARHRKNTDCTTPEPAVCTHGQCRNPVALDERCAHEPGPAVCCGCCWIVLVDEPVRR